MPLLSIIIVNYYSGPVLRECLASIFAAAYHPPLEVFVVNNSPQDPEAASIQEDFPHVRWHEMGYNAGFARANNAGIAMAQGQWILLLNSDTILGPETLVCSTRWLQTHTEYAACGATLLFPDGSAQVSGSRNMRGRLNYLLMIPYLGPLLGWLAKLGGMQKPHTLGGTAQAEAVDWINGAYLMVRKAAIEKAGLLDEDFFLYHEESEWCFRLQKAGKLAIAGQCTLIHIEGFSSAQAYQSRTKGHGQLTDAKGKQLFLSLMVRIRKELGAGWLTFHLMAFLFSLPLVWGIGILHGLLWLPEVLTTWAQLVRYTTNIIYPLGKLQYLLPNKPHFYKAA